MQHVCTHREWVTPLRHVLCSLVAVRMWGHACVWYGGLTQPRPTPLFAA